MIHFHQRAQQTLVQIAALLGTLTLSPFTSTTAHAQASPAMEVVMLEVDQPNSGHWHSVTFEATFAVPPIVVMGPPSSDDPDPTTIRVRKVTTTGFEFQLDEWDYQDGAHGTELVSYLAIEPGTHDLGGLQAEAGTLTTNDKPATQPFGAPFATPPVLLLQVSSANNPGALTACSHGANAIAFRCRLQAQEAHAAPLLPETISYLAIQPGAGSLAPGTPILAGLTPAAVGQGWHQVLFPRHCPSPILLSSLQTNNEADPATPRSRNLTTTGVQLRAQEEASKDPELDHAPEAVGYLVLGSGGDTDGDGLPDAWEDANGLGINDPSDAGLDPDGDGLTNLEEYAQGTDPWEADTDGDGLPDGDELAQGTSRTSPDTDGDGYPDSNDLAPLDPAVGGIDLWVYPSLQL